MKFCFSSCPSWFNNYIIEEFLDEFHQAIELSIGLSASRDSAKRNELLDFAVEFFKSKGIQAERQNRELWFNIDENDPKYVWLVLKWSE